MSLDTLKVLEEKQLQLTAIVVTHHHADHTAGIAELWDNNSCQYSQDDYYNEDKSRYMIRLDKQSKRIGIGRSRNEYSKLLENMRATGVPLGILTNGKQIRLIYAGMDYDCWVEWEVEKWFEDAFSGIEH